ncbi:hypothetical protein GWK47_047578 [Chionoecetes opilio]|uniref:Retrotransposon gag domain-containing protein n=1 Tax=Chionoecetes opilio TaxID=41210 RepID=A0A8J5CSN5_CHIOP|nr:hypothetical protein GWK47_007862 [Chionoecetes opilio]KAG0720874.1 hypothetical protein GWK47_047578 [Chionoecetes opilio]
MEPAGMVPPPPYLQEPGDRPSTTWSDWETRLTTFFTAVGAAAYSAARRKALLLHCVGAEAHRVHRSQPTVTKEEGEDEYDTTLRQLRLFYTPQVNVVVERFNFRQRSQRPGETTAEYVAALRGLAKHCKFGVLLEELIRDQVVEKTVHPILRKRFLRNKDLTLTTLLQQARAFEISIRGSKMLEASCSLSAGAPVQVAMLGTAQEPELQEACVMMANSS